MTPFPRRTVGALALGALPVVEGSRVVGILTKADVLAALIETLDIEGIGARIEVLLPRDAASVRKLVGLIGEKSEALSWRLNATGSSRSFAS